MPALTALHRLKNGNERLNADAREAVKWLDEITSMSSGDAADRVLLEGVDEAYGTWEEVEKFMLPETLLSMDDSESEDDDYHEDLESSFNALDVSDETSMSSTQSLDDNAPKTPESPRSVLDQSKLINEKPTSKGNSGALSKDSPSRTARNSSESSRGTRSPKRAVPDYLKPLFNHVLWRINKESNPDAALASYILLTNDPTKQMIASKFGIRAKRLEQLRDTVAREDREFKNHLTLHRIESESSMANKSVPVTPKVSERPKSSHSNKEKPEEGSDDEDVVLFHRAPRGPAATTNNQRVWDPNDFGRTKQQQTQSPRGRGGHVAARGRGMASPRGRGAFVPRGAYVPPGPAIRAPPPPRHDPNAPIDPNSFARPGPRASPARGGSGRKLWEPN